MRQQSGELAVYSSPVQHCAPLKVAGLSPAAGVASTCTTGTCTTRGTGGTDTAAGRVAGALPQRMAGGGSRLHKYRI